ncbi:hypothetical protein BVX93_01165, partial [bacterium B13(2017)]
MDATMEWAEIKGEPDAWKNYWQNPNSRIINFIGKDNIPFHLLVWPAMIMGQTTKYTLADNIPANEFLNLEGRQFSKSEGWYIDLESFFNRYKADQIRFSLASSAPEAKDSDFNWRDFQKYNNADLVGVLGNLVYRIMTFTFKNFDGKIPLGQDLPEEMLDLIKQVELRKNKIAELYNTYQVKKAAYDIIDLARLGNKFFDEFQPWKKIKENKEYCGKSLYTLFRLIEELAVCAWPILPDTTEAIFKQLGVDKKILEVGWRFDTAISPKGDHILNKPAILFRKIEDDQIKNEIQKLEQALQKKDSSLSS